MLKITTVVGARPQLVKAAVLSRQIRETPGRAEETLVHTGQHYDANMSAVFFEELDIPAPRHNLGIGGGTHGQNTGRMLEAIETLLLADRPDVVLVYGDTNTTLAAALAAAKLLIPVAHVEAGLRSFNRAMPEEVNRVLTDHVSSLLLAPTERAVRNLASEGIRESSVRLVGDVMYDAAIYYGARAARHADTLRARGIPPRDYALVTLHRQENTDDVQRLAAIVRGLGDVRFPIVWPVHPRTSKRLAAERLALPPNVLAIEPVSYLEMILLEQQARVIVTDSGGVQKEAYFHGVPCVTVRDETEWRELVDVGANRLVQPEEIGDAVSAATLLPADKPAFFGDGAAASAILRSLCETFA